MIITLTLNPSVDYILQVPKIVMEDTLRARHAYYQAGGKGINVSRVLTRLGVENVAWSFAGGDTGNWLRTYLDEAGVPTDFIETQGATRINTILTETETHSQLRVSAPGERLLNQEEQILMDRIRNLPTSTAWIAMGGSLLPGLTPACFRKLIEHARAQHIPTVLDADGAALKEGLQGRPYLIKPNQYELARLLGHDAHTFPEMVNGAREFIEQGLVEMVVISLGREGSLLVTKDLVLQGTAPKVQVMSKVGAGDSMVAGLLKGLLEKAAPQEMLRMGIAAGTAAVLTPGTELCHKHDYEALLDQVQVEPLTL